ncbi:MAG: endonuclease/exonuclease/phosphatase family protein [Clostridia bacterium]|nr:endonuclease/exonuclease/phosphatase family protein [Clostridia bacterium]
MKKFLKAIAILLAVVVGVVAIYFAYVMIDYHRIEDNLELDVQGVKTEAKVPVGKNLKILSYNIGFGAYTPEYSFFMDGGEYSRGFSEEAVKEDVQGAALFVKKQNPDFAFIQEVDIDSTRSYHIDEREFFKDAMDKYSFTFAQNYDSPYLFYPISKPHGKSVSGIMTFAKAGIESSVRRSLPIQTNLAKLLDLDRCYSVNKIPTKNGKYLCLYNFHLSAYTTDPEIVNQQLEMLYQDIQTQYDEGNYIICGGDFNKDLLGDSSKIFGVSGEDFSWAQPYPVDTIPNHFKMVAPYNKKHPVPSCRNADRPYDDTNFVLTIDGFIVSDNVKVKSADVYDIGFKYSDHNPVHMEFVLK